MNHPLKPSALSLHTISAASNNSPTTPPFWSQAAGDVLQSLTSSVRGLPADVAAARLKTVGPNHLKPARRTSPFGLFLRQVRSPLVLILIVAAMISAAVGQGHEAFIIVLIVLASCILGFTQEYGASRAVQALQKRLSHKVEVLRDGVAVTIAADDVVPGDVVRLAAGALIPADGLILEACDFNVTEAVLTGEPFPVLKSATISAPGATMAARTNAVFAGTSVRSGTALAVMVATGTRTEFARIAEAVERKIPETDFARGIRQFGALMTQIMLVMVLVVFAANLFLHRPFIDSLLFSLALAVGITPELLPAIISVTLARGARRMAKDGVIVRRLEAIENLGSMDVLCTDKTGTLTQGVIRLDAAFDASGRPSTSVLHLARLNAGLQTGLKNALDDAILAAPISSDENADCVKMGEVPYDFSRKRLSVLVREHGATSGDVLICKGAVQPVLGACTHFQAGAGLRLLEQADRDAIDARFRSWSAQGFRVLAVASREMTGITLDGPATETAMTLAGFLLFLDPPKAGIKETLVSLANRGIHIKMITGDNRYVACHLAGAIGFKAPAVMTGADLSQMTREALFAAAPRTDIFAEIDPNQKERIVAALRQAGHVVGYLGDGINDAPALHEADIGISVDTAVEVAREAADIILLKQDLGVLLTGVNDGRKTFVNTLKYISITTSANFGNMISMAVASLFLPFLPLLAKQILLNNFLSDVPSMAIATDTVESSVTRSPKRWDIGYIRRFMVCFGLISSAFDLVTFVFLLHIANTSASRFQTGWFVESLITELAIVFVVRTRQPIWRSHPGAWLTRLTAGVAVLAAALPFTPAAAWFGLVPLPLPVMAGLGLITLLYLATTEAAKHWFFAYQQHHPTRRMGMRGGHIQTHIRKSLP
ncbi:magnesium-translocating P-type ATPase [Asticcacaulis sp.]|uniref:magnesium-translocating P-type ATPase n=1 Tax=Asticcacaulis sp. TaxID=1872648 RepID=UPI002C00F29C|nr:magnesium-translocating P-type ATPase [Asticcacaulis sp.]HTM82814.1 magnesium-translocating P-type ATPase [Asticcacaulis sp.]